MKKMLSIILALIMSVGVFMIPAAAAGDNTGELTAQFGQTEARTMLDMVNEFRTGEDAWYWDRDNTTKVYAEGLEPLVYDYNLEKTAMQRAAEIAVYWGHTRPNGESCFTAFPDGYNAMGENIAAGYGMNDTAYEAYVSWREDDRNYSGQGHRRNMLSASFNCIGIGHVVVNGAHYWTQSLGRTGSSSGETAPNDSVTLVTIEYNGAYYTTELSGLESQYSGEVGGSIDLPELTQTLSSDEIWPFGSVSMAANPEWTVGDSAIANVTESKLNFIAAGTTTLTAAQNGASISAQVIVTAPPAPVVPSNITSSSVNFDGKLFLYTYVKPSADILADPGAYFSVTFDGKTTNYAVSSLWTDSQGRVRVEVEMFAAMLRNQMKLQLFNSAGEVQPLTFKETTDVTSGFVYSALDYLRNRQENSDNPEMRELALAAELYGTATQVYFNYKTEQLTADDIANMKAAASAVSIPAVCDEITSGQLPDGISKRTRTVLFEADNSLRQYFYFDTANLSKYTFMLNGNVVTPTQKTTGDAYYVEQTNIASALLSQDYLFSVSDGANTFQIRSSALSYAYNRQENSSSPDMVNLSKLLYRYSQAAEAYFN